MRAWGTQIHTDTYSTVSAGEAACVSHIHTRITGKDEDTKSSVTCVLWLPVFEICGDPLESQKYSFS